MRLIYSNQRFYLVCFAKCIVFMRCNVGLSYSLKTFDALNRFFSLIEGIDGSEECTLMSTIKNGLKLIKTNFRKKSQFKRERAHHQRSSSM